MDLSKACIIAALCLISISIFAGLDKINTTIKEKQIILNIADFNFDAAMRKGSRVIIHEGCDKNHD